MAHLDGEIVKDMVGDPVSGVLPRGQTYKVTALRTDGWYNVTSTTNKWSFKFDLDGDTKRWKVIKQGSGKLKTEGPVAADGEPMWKEDTRRRVRTLLLREDV